MNPKQPAGEAADEWPLHYDNPARRALREMGITRLTQLTGFKEAELLRLHSVGPKAIRLLREALAQRGLAFAPPEPMPAAKRQDLGGHGESPSGSESIEPMEALDVPGSLSATVERIE